MNTKAKIRSTLLEVLLGELAEHNPDGIQRSCISCLNFDEKNEICKRFQQRPPARIIALSCEHHEDKYDIPF